MNNLSRDATRGGSRNMPSNMEQPLTNRNIFNQARIYPLVNHFPILFHGLDPFSLHRSYISFLDLLLCLCTIAVEFRSMYRPR